MERTPKELGDEMKTLFCICLLGCLVFVGMEMRQLSCKLEEACGEMSQEIRMQTSQNSYLAKTYLKPVMPERWDLLSENCVTCGAHRSYWQLWEIGHE
jgi:hypothetical protein